MNNTSQEALEHEERNDYNNTQNVHFVSKEVTHICNKCESDFLLRNKLFKHLRENCRKTKPTANVNKRISETQDLFKTTLDKFSTLMINNTYMNTIIKSTAELSHVRPEYNFRSWKYIIIKVRYSSNSKTEESEVSLDSDCDVTLKDRAYLLKHVSDLKIKKMTFFISIRDVNNKIVSIDKYAMITIYIKEIVDDMERSACLTMKIHVVNNLKTNILIETDIMTPQGMTMNLKTRTVKLERCQGLNISIDVVARTQPHSKRIIRIKSSIIITPNIITEVPIAYNDTISENKDFLFESDCAQEFEPADEIFAHIVDFTISIIQVYNATTAPMRLSRKTRLGALYEYEQDGAFLTTPAEANLAAENVKSWKKNLAKGIAVTAAAFAELVQKSLPNTTSTIITETFCPQIDPSLEHIMPNDIIIYDTPKVASQIAFVTDEFSKIWKDQDITIDIPEEEWMSIPLKSNITSKSSRVYPVS